MDARSVKALRQRLESLAEAGVRDLPKRAGRSAAVSSVSGPLSAPVAADPPPRPASAELVPRDAVLESLRQRVAGCTRCVELAGLRTHTVFGAGPSNARVCFLGEAPGAEEDASGEPFVGRAGQLLTKIIEACTLRREEVYILNVLKCRPPGNRAPATDEVAHCREFLEAQLSTIAPEFICCLGTTAAQALLRTTTPIGRLRGTWYTHGSAQVLCTYHPSYLLRTPAAKRDVWEDMKLLMERMGLPPRAGGG